MASPGFASLLTQEGTLQKGFFQGGEPGDGKNLDRLQFFPLKAMDLVFARILEVWGGVVSEFQARGSAGNTWAC